MIFPARQGWGDVLATLRLLPVPVQRPPRDTPWRDSTTSKEALAEVAKTKRLGAPVLIDVRVQADILRLDAEGASLRQIAAALNASGAKPARGGMRWYASTIKSVIDRCEALNVAA